MATAMRERLRSHTVAITGLLSIVSLALVFGAVGGYVPDGLLPHNETLVMIIPHVNVAISLAAIASITIGVRAIRSGRIDRHRRAMLASTLLFATFLVLYLYRLSLEGPTTFEGPDVLYQFVYLPILAIHILFAIICLPFVFHALLLAGTRPIEQLPETVHARVGRVAAFLWVVSFALGITIYLLLRVLF